MITFELLMVLMQQQMNHQLVLLLLGLAQRISQGVSHGLPRLRLAKKKIFRVSSMEASCSKYARALTLRICAPHSIGGQLFLRLTKK